MEEVKRHNTRDDAWMVLSGRVYNITPYMAFHPGGADILMAAAGKDGTALFQRYHPWVNGHALLEACLLGAVKVRAALRASVRARARARACVCVCVPARVSISAGVCVHVGALAFSALCVRM